jgi:hypothetical protein
MEYDGNTQYFHDEKVYFNPVRSANNNTIYIELSRNDVVVDSWEVIEQELPMLLPMIPDKNNKDALKHTSPMMFFFVKGKTDGKPYRYLYSRALVANNDFIVGTRTDLGARYDSNCRSKKQRAEETPEIIHKKLLAERRYARKMRKQLLWWQYRFPNTWHESLISFLSPQVFYLAPTGRTERDVVVAVRPLVMLQTCKIRFPTDGTKYGFHADTYLDYQSKIKVARESPSRHLITVLRNVSNAVET